MGMGLALADTAVAAAPQVGIEVHSMSAGDEDDHDTDPGDICELTAMFENLTVSGYVVHSSCVILWLRDEGKGDAECLATVAGTLGHLKVMFQPVAWSDEACKAAAPLIQFLKQKG